MNMAAEEGQGAPRQSRDVQTAVHGTVNAAVNA